MRLIVILSPTNRWGTKTAYTKLRDFLKSDGYIRIAPEVFMRITNNRKATEKHVQRLKPLDPGTGTVQIFRLSLNEKVTSTFKRKSTGRGWFHKIRYRNQA